MAAARKHREAGPLSILQLHGRFDGSAKDRRIVRLMNHWGGKARHDILIADPAASSARDTIDQAVPVTFLGEPAFGAEGGPGRFLALAQRMRAYDLVLSFGWGAIDGVITQRLFGLLMGLPPLIHHEDGTELRAVGPLGLGSDFYRRFSLSAARALVVPTGRLAHVAIDQWHEAAAHVKHIPDGIDVQSFAGKRLHSEIPGLNGEKRLIVGACIEDAGPPLLDQLFRAVEPIRDKVRLVLLDAPGEGEMLSARATARGIHDLLVPDRLPRPKDYLAALDIFVQLAEAEPNPGNLTEAMAAGLPVAATDAGDVCDMLPPANRNLVAKTGDVDTLAKALEQLATDVALREKLGKANHRRALQCFDESVMFELYARLYGGAVGRDQALL